jgi:hypothetical protein
MEATEWLVEIENKLLNDLYDELDSFKEGLSLFRDDVYQIKLKELRIKIYNDNIIVSKYRNAEISFNINRKQYKKLKKLFLEKYKLYRKKINDENKKEEEEKAKEIFSLLKS